MKYSGNTLCQLPYRNSTATVSPEKIPAFLRWIHQVNREMRHSPIEEYSSPFKKRLYPNTRPSA